MLMGLSSEAIDERISSILEFAEIGDFAYQPVKTYSSGMFARLAFATSINVEPDILIIDEALSVGDMYFQEKCYEKMKEMVQSGATILFVSHSLPAVRNFCNRAIWIERGVMRMEGSAKRVCEEYRNFLENKTKSFSTNKTIKILPQEGKEKNKILITGVRLNQGSFYMNEDILISIKLEYRIEQVNFGVGIIIQNDKNELVTLFNTIRDDYVIKDKIPQISLSIPSNDFVAGHYRIQVNLCDDMIMYPYDKVDDAAEFEILSITNKRGIPISEGHFRAKHRWQIP